MRLRALKTERASSRTAKTFHNGRRGGDTLSETEKAWLGYKNWSTEWSDESLASLKRDEERDQQEGTEGWYEDNVSWPNPLPKLRRSPQDEARVQTALSRVRARRLEERQPRT